MTNLQRGDRVEELPIKISGVEQPKRIWLMAYRHDGDICWSADPNPEDADEIEVVEYVRTDQSPEAVTDETDTSPWADYHGPLPDYDHPLRPVFESGIQYAVELLAKMLKVENWEICDGTEEFDGDLGGTLLNIVIETWPKDEHGDWVDFRDAETRDAALLKVSPR